MDSISIAQSLVFGIFLVFFAFLGFSYRTSDTDDFHTAHRSAGPLRILMSMFTIVGASEFVIFTTLAFIFGWHAIFFFVGTFFGFVTLGVLAPFIREKSIEYDHHTIPDFAATRGYPLVTGMLAVTSWAFTMALVVMQIIIGGNLIADLTSIPLHYTAAAICVAVTFYLIFGGYKAVLNTDVVQGLVLFVVTIIFGFAVYASAPEIATWNVEPIPGVQLDIIVFAIGGFFAIVGGPEVWQRILTSKTDMTARKTSIASGIVMAIWGSALVIGTLAIRATIPEANFDTAFFSFLNSDVSPIMLGFITLMLIAALLSTADTELFAATVIVQKAVKKSSEPLTIAASQFFIVLFMIIAYLAAINTQNLLNIYFALIYITFITGPIGVALVLRRGNAWSYGVSVASSLLVLVVLYASNNLVSWYPLLILFPGFLPFFIAEPQSMEN